MSIIDHKILNGSVNRQLNEVEKPLKIQTSFTNPHVAVWLA